MDKFINDTSDALRLLNDLDCDRSFSDKSASLSLCERLLLFESLNYKVTYKSLLSAITMWDYSGKWQHWLLEDTSNFKKKIINKELKKSDIEYYKKYGFLIIKSVLDLETLNDLKLKIDLFLEKYLIDNSIIIEQNTPFFQLKNLRLRNLEINKFITSTEFVKFLYPLLNESSLRIYHDQVLYKYPQASITDWHQDNLYFPLNTNKTLTIWIPLEDSEENMGNMQFVKKSNKIGYLGFNPIGSGSKNFYKEYIEQNQLQTFNTRKILAGDISIHNGWTIHSANANKSTKIRKSLVITFYPDNTKISKPKNSYQERVVKYMFKGLKIGDYAHGSSNTLIHIS